MALPPTPRNPDPEDGLINTPINYDLYWTSESSSHDVYFGSTNPPPLVAERIPDNYLRIALLKGQTYYWQVVARNDEGEAVTPIWSFQTETALPPPAPSNPNPSNRQTEVSTGASLYWNSDSINNDVYFGETNPPPLVAERITNRYLDISITENQTYYWQVVSRNETGETASPIWSFTTTPPPPPVPEPPTNLRTTEVKISLVALTWDTPDTPTTEFLIFRDGVYIAYRFYPTYFDNSVSRNTSYSYEVRASNQSGTSAPSEPIFVTTPDTNPLSSEQQAQINFHIKYAQLEPIESSRLTQEYTSGEIAIISNQLQKCETAFDLTRLNAGNLVVDRQETTEGGITVNSSYPTRYGNSVTITTYGDQTKTWSKRRTYQQRLDDYYKEVKLLREILEP